MMNFFSQFTPIAFRWVVMTLLVMGMVMAVSHSISGAEPNTAGPSEASTEAATPTGFQNDLGRLKQLTSFEVESFQDNYALDNFHIRPELIQFSGTALRQEPILPKSSPAQGVITLRCVGHDCRYVRAEVHDGSKDAVVIWQRDFKNYWLYTGGEFYSEERNDRDLAKDIIKAIAQDYQTSTL